MHLWLLKVLITMYRYRLNEEKAEWIIYVTDVGQQQHFDMVFKVWIQSQILYPILCWFMHVVFHWNFLFTSMFITGYWKQFELIYLLYKSWDSTTANLPSEA